MFKDFSCKEKDKSGIVREECEVKFFVKGVIIIFLYFDGVFIRTRNIDEERGKNYYGRVRVGMGNGI